VLVLESMLVLVLESMLVSAFLLVNWMVLRMKSMTAWTFEKAFEMVFATEFATVLEGR